jgi:hypothetical protein
VDSLGRRADARRNGNVSRRCRSAARGGFGGVCDTTARIRRSCGGCCLGGRLPSCGSRALSSSTRVIPHGTTHQSRARRTCACSSLCGTCAGRSCRGLPKCERAGLRCRRSVAAASQELGARGRVSPAARRRESSAAIAMMPSWLQALAAIVQAGVAIALYRITKSYVELTGRLAIASEAQVELLRAERSETRSNQLKQLSLLAQSLLKHLRQLPGPASQQRADRLIREAILPTDQQLDELRNLAAAVGLAVSQLAGSAVEHLAWLLRWAREIQGVRPEVGFDYRKMSWPDWCRHWTEAEQALEKLAGG